MGKTLEKLFEKKMVEKHVCVIPTITQAPPGNIWPQHHLYPVLIFLQAPLSMIPALRLFFPHVLVFTWSPIPLVFQKNGRCQIQ
jgi:hypothetical protein